MKIHLLGSAAALLLATAAPAFADSIDFAQFGPVGTSVSDGATGTTYDGVNFTINSPSGDGFSEYQESLNWNGEFSPNEVILFDNNAPGITTIDFATAINSILHLEIQANDSGPYTETLTAFSGATDLGSVSANGDNVLFGAEGTAPYLDFTANGITSIELSTTNDGAGYALGGTGGTNNAPPGIGVPEPITLSLFGAGLAGAAAMRRRKKANKA